MVHIVHVGYAATAIDYNVVARSKDVNDSEEERGTTIKWAHAHTDCGIIDAKEKDKDRDREMVNTHTNSFKIVLLFRWNW